MAYSRIESVRIPLELITKSNCKSKISFSTYSHINMWPVTISYLCFISSLLTDGIIEL